MLYEFNSKFVAFTDFGKKNFSKKLIVFPKKPAISYVLRNITIPVSSYGKVALIWWLKKFKVRIWAARIYGK